jgi:hypothetical protein
VESYFHQLESDCGSEDSECEASFSGDWSHLYVHTPSSR